MDSAIVNPLVSHPPARVIGRKAALLQGLGRSFTATKRELNISISESPVALPIQKT
ncbi:MAG: hypothetical protein M3N49_12120 [Candidatus Eremiobacteraeota bacterium]|nr:hypothetical protein [Candidatus Eremiobacteraeota bacterium]